MAASESWHHQMAASESWHHKGRADVVLVEELAVLANREVGEPFAKSRGAARPDRPSAD
jgi:hypothetical protein